MDIFISYLYFHYDLHIFEVSFHIQWCNVCGKSSIYTCIYISKVLHCRMSCYYREYMIHWSKALFYKIIILILHAIITIIMAFCLLPFYFRSCREHHHHHQRHPFDVPKIEHLQNISKHLQTSLFSAIPFRWVNAFDLCLNIDVCPSSVRIPCSEHQSTAEQEIDHVAFIPSRWITFLVEILKQWHWIQMYILLYRHASSYQKLSSHLQWC